MKVTAQEVRRVAGIAAKLSAGTFGLTFVAKPGDPERYAGKTRTFVGRGATRQAAAFYAGVAAELTGGALPGVVRDVLAEVGQRHAADVAAGRAVAARWLARDTAGAA